MDGAGEHNDDTEKSNIEKKEGKKKEIEKNENEESEEKDLSSSLNPKPVVVKNVTGYNYKLKTLKSKLEKQEQHQLTDSDDVVIDAIPLNSYPPGTNTDFDLTQLEPALKKLKVWVEGNYFKARISDSGGKPDPIPTRVLPKIKNIRPIPIPKPPEPKLVLMPPRVTFLRPKTDQKPDPKPVRVDMDDPTNMGPPPPPPELGKGKTAYEIVKDSLTFLKSEYGLSAKEYNELLEYETSVSEEYSISRVTRDSLFSMEDVILELDLFLNSMPETASYDFMNQMLLAFQTRLGLPPRPRWYNLMMISPKHFMNYLDSVHQKMEIDDDDSDDDDSDEASGEIDDDCVDSHGNKPVVIRCRGETSGHKHVVARRKGEKRAGDDDDDDDDVVRVPVRNERSSSIYRAPFSNLPSPRLPFHEAIEILHGFVRSIENDDEFVLDERAFLNLQCDLMLPEWCSLFELYKLESMEGVVDFIHNYFKNTKVIRIRPSVWKRR